MIDEPDLRERFARLRAEELRSVPRFDANPMRPKHHAALRLTAAVAALLLIVIVAITIRSRPTRFSDADRAVARSVAEWQPPTDFLLQTPGSEMLSTTPRIPDLKGVVR